MRRFRFICFSNNQHTISTETDQLSPERKFCDKFGYTHDVLVKNVNIYADDASIVPIIEIYSLAEDRPIENITLRNIRLNGKKIEDFNKFDTLLRNHKNVMIK